MRATAAIAELLRSSEEWREFYRSCCETGALRLRAQAWQFRAELRDRGLAGHGEPLALADVEDALLEIARKVLPETPAALKGWEPSRPEQPHSPGRIGPGAPQTKGD